MFKIDHENSHKHNDFTFTFKFVSVDGKIKPGVQHYFSKLHQLGMHYHVVYLGTTGEPYKLDNRVVRRHYTTSNILET